MAAPTNCLASSAAAPAGPSARPPQPRASAPARPTAPDSTLPARLAPWAHQLNETRPHVPPCRSGSGEQIPFGDPRGENEGYRLDGLVGIDVQASENTWPTLHRSINDAAKQLRRGPPGLVA